MDKEKLYKCFQEFLWEATELHLDAEIPVLDAPPSPLAFYRDWVSPNRPVVIRGLVDHWPALNKWSTDYLRGRVGEARVTVTVTPHGYADAVYDGKFVMGENRVMTFNAFLDVMEKKRKVNGIFYVQKQNSNFTDEFKQLMEDASPDLPMATQALGKSPDAVNFWMGEETAISSMHKDNYENLYCVVRGSKTFTLLSPVCQPFVPYKEYQAASFKENEEGTFEVIDDNDTGKVPWISVDPLDPDLDEFPSFAEVNPITVKVEAGDTLYLPSLWFHHVQQSRGAIAVNYWYDMEYDIKYSYYKLVENMVRQKGGAT